MSGILFCWNEKGFIRPFKSFFEKIGQNENIRLAKIGKDVLAVTLDNKLLRYNFKTRKVLSHGVNMDLLKLPNDFKVM